MDTFIAVCLGLIVLELGIMIAVFIFVMLKVKDAASAVEVAAYRVDQEVLSVGETLRSGWLGTLKTVFSAGLSLMRR
ncbi:MAG: hypothetical protein PHS14_12380 [Elusimicrobia bacterium]|nr:hypothetical protein [Elusimicrobiota bacterium]